MWFVTEPRTYKRKEKAKAMDASLDKKEIVKEHIIRS